ncbi:MAG: RNA polymerase sporulation sigma factor SigK [Clostridia bacterium]|nr:RNA polymerase sporulation sigma factor SigK [Clostridia bacterium]
MLALLSALLHGLCFFGAIGDSAAFPEPLSKEEESFWIQKLSQGDEEAREQLIVHNLRLVAHIARKFERNPSEREDLISCGAIGLIKAVSTFSEDKGALSAYASRCIENEILMSYRRDRKLVQTISFDEAVGHDKEGNDLPLAELIATEEESIFEQVLRRLDTDRVYRAMRRCLSKREQTVLALRFGLNGGAAMAQREAANVLGISRSYVSRIESKAMAKLRAALGAEEE